MKASNLLWVALLAATFVACDTTPSDPGTPPPAATMSFKQGARYEYMSYQTDPQTNAEMSATRRNRTWTLVNTSATVRGRSNVAVYVDSIVSGGPIITVADTIYLQQQSGSNDIYRFASLAPELDFAGTSIIEVDLGKQWMHEARLNATTARWFVGEAADTVQMNLSIPGLQGVKVAITDSAIASTTENVTIKGTSYRATKTTHSLELSLSALINIPILGMVPVKLGASSLTRTTWIVPSLGAIVREDREGKVLEISSQTYSGIQIEGFSLPVPGYHSEMTNIISTGQ